MSMGVQIAVGAAIGFVLGIGVSVATDIPFAPEGGLAGTGRELQKLKRMLSAQLRIG